ncbi:hypothetical protein ACIOZM_07740 [Pseudomonas sp. NPDC087346]|uniref:hypothetical protein n=1 Tax=Pseudomonas sp. NPDC087346 TaxID=3364438 RepID=UPI0038093694
MPKFNKNGMHKSDLCLLAKIYGFTVVIFSDHSEFCSSWTLSLKKHENKFMIENDGRDGWMIFYKEDEPDKFKELDKVISHTFSDNEKVKQCEIWLSSI